MAKKRANSPKLSVDLNQLQAWQLPMEDIDRLLVTSDDPRLKTIFGNDYEPLRQLARQATRTARSRRNRVLLVPGILGSTIGKPGNLLTRDTIWFDPVSLRRGDIRLLKLGANGRTSLVSLDVVPTVHAYLRLRLMMLGFSVEYFHYDWRQSLTVLGRQLASHVKNSGGSVSIVAHSMGGLVCRAALKVGMPDVDRVVMLGTPNQGSFSSVEVLQGINSNVVLVDKLDPHHDAAKLTRTVFSTFPSIYELLPRPEIFKQVDLFEPANWPTSTYRPSASRLKDAQKTWTKLADADPRLRLIAGSDQMTVTSLTKSNDGEFTYQATTAGDGTVPLDMCMLPSVPTWHVTETHTGLLRSEIVARAVADLINTGETERLPVSPARQVSRQAAASYQRDAFLDDPHRPRMLSSHTGAAIDPDEIPVLLESALSMGTLPAEQTLQSVRKRRAGTDSTATESMAAISSGGRGPEGSVRLTSGITFNQTVISRDHQSHLELELYHGNVFDVPYRAIVLGIFSNVDPAGPAGMLDTLMNGAVSELRSRRMFDAAAGKVFVMPVGRNALKADYVVFAGLGEYSLFSQNPESVLQTISCNVLRTLMNCGVDEFATLIYGSASGLSTRGCVESLIKGYLDALKALGTNDMSVQFRRVALCELVAERYAELKDEAYRLGGTELCRDVRLRLHESRYPAYAASLQNTLADRVQRLHDRQPGRIVYLTARIDRAAQGSGRQEIDTWTLHAALLGAGKKATIFCSARHFNRTTLDDHLSQLPDGLVNTTTYLTPAALLRIGTELRELLFTSEFLQVLAHDLTREDHLAVIVDEAASRIPWEIIPLLDLSSGNDVTVESLSCVRAGVSRRFLTDGSHAVARYLEERQQNEILQVLLIINPTGDLPGAEKEGRLLERVLSQLNLVRFHTLRQTAATRDQVLERLASGKYDVVHYAGHAYFDPVNRSESGLICAGTAAGDEPSVLSGRDLASLTHLPGLVLFNACESARIRSLPVTQGTVAGLSASVRKKKSVHGDRSEQQAGVGEALLRGGISQFIGTYWPVEDQAAAEFARQFYAGLLAGKTVRESVLDGRIAVQALDSADLANYLHYGDPTFVVKDRRTEVLRPALPSPEFSAQ